MKRQFEIAATAASFDILSNKLYSNPSLAVLRELSTNANDSHIQAGVDLPIKLHLPRQNENYFKIRDFGKGLSETEISCIYCSFFVSTKTDDEGQTGYFGLGAKSPFAISDEFFVTSFQNGEKMVYRMSKDNGIPVYELINKTNTEEQDGIEVLIQDFKAPSNGSYFWEGLAKKFFLSTSFLPEMNLVQDDYDNLIQKRPFFQKNNISFSKESGTLLNVNVAGVGFEVEYSSVSKKLCQYLLNLSSIGIKTINIIANKSDVDITPSREELQFTDKTNLFIENKLKEIINEFDNKDHSDKELFDLQKKISNEDFTNLFKNTSKKILDLQKRISYLPFEISFYKNMRKKRLGYNTYLETYFFNTSNYYYIVDINNISKVLQNSIDLIFKENNKITILYDYLSNFLKNEDTSKASVILTKNPKETKSIFDNIGLNNKCKIVKLNEMLKGENHHREIKVNNKWVTNQSYIIDKYDYVIAKEKNMDFDNSEFICVVCNNYSNTLLSYPNQIHQLLKIFDKENQIYVLRSGSEEWCKKQVETGKAILAKTAISNLEKKYYKELYELKIKNELSKIVAQFRYFSNGIIKYFSTEFVKKPEISKIIEIFEKNDNSFYYKNLCDIELSLKDKKYIQDMNDLLKIEEKLVEKNPILLAVSNYNNNSHTNKIIAQFIEENY